MKKGRKPLDNGFSLIEVIIALGIMGLFAGGVMSAAAGIRQWQAEIRSRAIFNELEIALRLYRGDHGSWPDCTSSGEQEVNAAGESCLEALGPYLETLNPELPLEDGFGNRNVYFLVDLDGDNWIDASDFLALPDQFRPVRIRQRIGVYSLHSNGQLAACNWQKRQ